MRDWLQAAHIVDKLVELSIGQRNLRHTRCAHLGRHVVEQIGQLVAGELCTDANERWCKASALSAGTMAGDTTEILEVLTAWHRGFAAGAGEKT